jgi:hypothetical protein
VLRTVIWRTVGWAAAGVRGRLRPRSLQVPNVDQREVQRSVRM